MSLDICSYCFEHIPKYKVHNCPLLKCHLCRELRLSRRHCSEAAKIANHKCECHKCRETVFMFKHKCLECNTCNKFIEKTSHPNHVYWCEYSKSNKELTKNANYIVGYHQTNNENGGKISK